MGQYTRSKTKQVFIVSSVMWCVINKPFEIPINFLFSETYVILSLTPNLGYALCL